MQYFRKAESAIIYGFMTVGRQAYLAQGAVLRSIGDSIVIGHHSIVLENSVIVGNPKLITRIGEKVVFGHRTLVIGAAIGNLCEIGNACIIMPKADIGDWCILGEGTLIPEGMKIPSHSVVVGRPGRIIRSLTITDQAVITRLLNGDTALSGEAGQAFQNGILVEESTMGKLYAYKNQFPQIAKTAFLFDSAEITGDVIVGDDCIIGAGVKIIGDSHGPVRIGSKVQILENTVLHLLPDNRLVIEDDVVIGPGCMIHGCKIGQHSVIEPGAIVCDYSEIGANSLVKAGSVVKQRSTFPNNAVIEGFPAKPMATLAKPLDFPRWALTLGELRSLLT
jgi:carbonic anhydrase/acetyltransferase-like protein (isoleucine patch superfamily)